MDGKNPGRGTSGTDLDRRDVSSPIREVAQTADFQVLPRPQHLIPETGARYIRRNDRSRGCAAGVESLLPFPRN